MVVSDVHGRGSRAKCPRARGARCGRDVGGSVDRMGAVARARAGIRAWLRVEGVWDGVVCRSLLA